MTQSNEGSENYYQTYLSKRPVSQFEQPITRQYSTSNKYQRQQSEHSVKSGRGDQPREPSRRQNYVINNLRNELQNIKSQVVKLMSHDSPMKIKSNAGDNLNERVQRLDKKQYPTTRVDRFMDNSSTSSFALSRPKQKLRTQQVQSKQKYFELQNEILKNELKNLKNKYVLRKSQFKQQKETLHKKIYFLQEVIARNEQQMSQYKTQIQNEIFTIRQDMVGRIQNASTNYTQSPRSPSLEKENNQLKQQILYLKKRTAEANDQIKKMAIENNDLNNQLKNKRLSGDDTQILGSIKYQFQQKLKQKQILLVARDEQISNILQKQHIANEVVKKNAELIDALNLQRQNYIRLQLQFQHLKSAKVPQQENELLQRHQELINQYDILSRSNADLQNDLAHLSNVLTNLKIQNQQLLMHKNTSVQSSQNIGSIKEIEELTEKNQCLTNEMDTIKGHINGMVQQTVQKMRELQMNNHYFRNRIAELERQNVNLHSELSAFSHQQISLSQATLVKKASSQDVDKCGRRVQQLQSWKITLEQSLQAKQRELSSLRYELKKFSEIYAIKCKQVQQIQDHYSNQLQKETSKQSYLNSIIMSLTNKVEQTISQSHQTIANYKQQIQIFSKNDQIQQINDLKELVRSNNEQIQRLRQDIVRYKYALDNAQSTIQMQRTKWITEKKGVQTSLQSEIQMLRKQLTISNKTIDSLGNKLQFLSKQLNNKNQIISQHIKQNGFVNNFEQLIHSYQDAFSVEQIKNNLSSELLQIQRLTNDNITLMKQITRLQEDPNIKIENGF